MPDNPYGVQEKIHKYYPIPCLGKILSLFGHLKQQGLAVNHIVGQGLRKQLLYPGDPGPYLRTYYESRLCIPNSFLLTAIYIISTQLNFSRFFVHAQLIMP